MPDQHYNTGSGLTPVVPVNRGRGAAANAHEKAIEVHNRVYDDMVQMRKLHGRDSTEYRQALADVRAAAKLIRPAFRAVQQERKNQQEDR